MGVSNWLEENEFASDRVVAIHSSFRAARSLAPDPVRFVEEILGSRSGCTLFPTFTGQAEDGPRTLPVFDVRETPCWTGLIPEAARRVLGPRRRSLHPTHSWMVSGEGWERLMEGWQDVKTPCGEGSPLRNLVAEDGLVILLGVGLESLTLMHACEEAAGAPYVLQEELMTLEMTNAEGDKVSFGPTRLHSWATPRNYPALAGELESEGCLRTLKGPCPGFVVEANALFHYMVERLKGDPASVIGSV